MYMPEGAHRKTHFKEVRHEQSTGRWIMEEPSVIELPAMLSRYLSVSDGRIIASALLGLIGIPGQGDAFR